jgi:methionyl-tRNA synthetase
VKIIHAAQKVFSTLYGIQCYDIIDSSYNEKLPFSSKLCIVKPGEKSIIHNHHEYERFFICKGKAKLTIGQNTQVVGEGDEIVIPVFSDHTISNIHPTDDLHFLTFWWEDLDALKYEKSFVKNVPTTLIFSTPPTPNGDLHLGHLSGPYTGADIYRRYLNLKGTRTYHATGRDDNQSYVPRKALNQGIISPENLADYYAVKIQRTLKHNQITIDHFSEPKNSSNHVSFTKKMARELYDKNLIYAKQSNALFCRATGEYLYEAHVRGLCPHCQSESDGNACEQCGRPNDCVDLINPKSKYGNQGVEVREITRLYFRLSSFTEQLRTYHRQVVMSAHILALCEEMLEDGLPDICISHISNWGIAVSIEGFEDQRFYVWFEMALGYLAAAQDIVENRKIATSEFSGWETFYANDSSEVIHFFGFDNSYFHAILFPAIYMGLDKDIHLPKAFVINELLNLDGLKFSTSRGHLIWGIDLLKIVPSDYVRYYLSYIRPENEKTNFTLSHFIETIEKFVIGDWQSWLNAMYNRCEKLFSNKAPATGDWTAEQRAYYERLLRMLDEANKAYQYSDFSPQYVCMISNELVRQVTRFMASQQHLFRVKTCQNQTRTAVALELLTAKILSIIINPIMPGFSQKLWNSLEGDKNIEWTENLNFVSDSTIINRPLHSFFENISENINELYP